MRHILAGAILIGVALAVTMGVATVLQDMATARNPSPEQEYVPPPLRTTTTKTKPGEKSRSVMLSRRLNDHDD
jgi:uncharacterized protein YcfJ